MQKPKLVKEIQMALYGQSQAHGALKFVDETFREGTERAPFYSPLSEKTELIKQMAEAGIRDFIVGAGPESTELIEKLDEMVEQGEIHKDCEFTFICLMNTWKTTHENFRKLPRELIRKVRISFGMIDNLDFELAVEEFRKIGVVKFKASVLNNFTKGITTKNLNRIFNEIDRAVSVGINIVRLNDSLGKLTPNRTFDICRRLVIKYPTLRFVIHCHNDNGLALANTLASIHAGFTMIEGSLAGLGNRSGITALGQLVSLINDEGYDTDGPNIDLQSIITAEQLAEAHFLVLPSLYRAVSGFMISMQTMGVINIPAYIGTKVENLKDFLPFVGIHHRSIKSILKRQGVPSSKLTREYCEAVGKAVGLALEKQHDEISQVYKLLVARYHEMVSEAAMTKERVLKIANSLPEK